MAKPRKIMPTGKKLEKLRKQARKSSKVKFMHYNGSTHKVLLYAKFKKKAFSWDDWNNFHADNYFMRRSSGDSFHHLLVQEFLYHRVIDGLDYFQITPEGELQLIILAEKEQARRAKLASQSSARGRATVLARQAEYDDEF